jgi:hypothetical protein
MHVIANALFGAAPRSVVGPGLIPLPPQADARNTSPAVFAAAGAGAMQAVGFAFVLYKAVRALLLILQDELLFFLSVILLPVMIGAAMIGLWLFVVALTSSTGLALGDRRAWNGGSVSSASALVIGQLVFVGAGWIFGVLALAGGLELALLILTWNSRAAHL